MEGSVRPAAEEGTAMPPAEPVVLQTILVRPGPLAAAEASPVGVGSLLGRTFSVWWKNLIPFSGVALLLQSPLVVMPLLLDGSPPGDEALWNGLGTLASLVLGLVVAGALTHGVIRSLNGEPVRLVALLGTGFRKMWRILLASLGVGIATVVGLLLLVVPGLIAMSALYLAVPAVVVEPIPPGRAISRSWRLTRGHRLHLFLLLFLFGLLGAGVGGFVAALGLAGSPSLIALGQALSVVLQGLSLTAPAVAYHDLRVAREGVDTAQLVRVFE
jgi:hypothetical protein